MEVLLVGKWQGAGAFCSKTSLLQQGELERQWRLDSGRVGLTSACVLSLKVAHGSSRWVPTYLDHPTAGTDHAESRTPSEPGARCKVLDEQQRDEDQTIGGPRQRGRFSRQVTERRN